MKGCGFRGKNCGALLAFLKHIVHHFQPSISQLKKKKKTEMREHSAIYYGKRCTRCPGFQFSHYFGNELMPVRPAPGWTLDPCVPLEHVGIKRHADPTLQFHSALERGRSSRRRSEKKQTAHFCHSVTVLHPEGLIQERLGMQLGAKDTVYISCHTSYVP